MIGIISRNASFHQALSRGLAILGFVEIRLLQPDRSILELQVQSASLLVVDAHLAFRLALGDGRISWAHRLRACYQGAIIFLAFAPRTVVRAWPGGELIDTPGCAFGQLPLTLAEFRRLLAAATPPTPSEWDLVSWISRCKELAGLASSLGHRYENTFSQALSSLLELEKLSHFSALDFQKVGKEIQIIHSRLTEERLSNFFADLKTLHVKAADLDLMEAACSLEDLNVKVEEVKRCLPSLRLDESAWNRDDLFRTARNIRSVLKELLTFITSIKEKATREITSGNENPLRR